MIRRSFLATLLMPFLRRFAPKPQLNSGVAIARAAAAKWKHPLAPTYCELPYRINDLCVVQNELYALTSGGIYRVFCDGTYEELDPEPFVIVKIPDPLPWEPGGAGLTPAVEMTKAEFRERYPA